MFEGLGYFSYEERRRLFCLENKRLVRVLINVYKYLNGECKEDGARLFSVVPSDRTSSNAHKQKHMSFSLNIRKRFFPVRVTKHWHRLPREVVASPSWRYSKAVWTWFWAACSGWPCLSRGVGPFHLWRSLPVSAIL